MKNMKDLTKKYLDSKKELVEKCKELVSCIEYRAQFTNLNGRVWDESITSNALEYSNLESIYYTDDGIVITFLYYDDYDDFTETYTIKYLNMFDDMTYDEIADHVIKESKKLNEEERIKEIEYLEKQLKYLKAKDCLNEFN